MNRSLKSSGFCSGAEEPDSSEPTSGLCGCGKPVRYMIAGDVVSYACNKYVRCPSWDELNAKLIETATIIGELIQWLKTREGELEELKEKTSSTGKRANFGSQAKAYKDVLNYIEQRTKG